MIHDSDSEEENILFQNPDPDSDPKPVAILFSKKFKPPTNESDEEDDDQTPGENGKFMPKKHELEFEFFGKKTKIIQNAKECCGGTW